MLKVKELKEILKECDDEQYISLEYCGSEMELENGDTFMNIDPDNIELTKHYINIVFV